MEKMMLDVHGMDCTGCEESITKALKRLQGVATCTASHTDAKVEVEFDSGQVGLEAIHQAILEAGYEVAPAG
ncbi:MAG: cation transporter [Chloroflexi bacterium]|nr:cation transporter [Chloroflexota bacterium]